MRKYLSLVFLFIFVFSIAIASVGIPRKPTGDGPPVYVIFWFDYEDYISGKPSNEAAIKIADIMKRNGVKAVFKVVGMKAEEIERKRLSKVTSALSYHQVGFHSYNHSIHPTIGQYLKGKSLSEGISEFKNRESQGVAAVKRVFGKSPVCYGQPGSAWAPQVYPVLKEWGINLYLDEGNHIGIDNQPFWYMGVLNIYRMRSTVIKLHALATKDDLNKAERKAKRAWSLLRRRGGGVISTYSHPQEFVTRIYWDRLNFERGKNTPPDKWIKPPLRSNEEIKQSFNNLEEYTQFLLSLSGVKPVTPEDLLSIYHDRAPETSFSPPEILELACSVEDSISFAIRDGFSLSPAEIFSILVNFLATYNSENEIPKKVMLRPIFKGPASRIDTNGKEVALADFYAAVSRLKKIFDSEQRIPDFIEVNKAKVSPIDFLNTLAWVVEELISGENPGEKITIIPGAASFERYIWEKNVWKWSVFPEGFSAPNLIDIAKLQAWTLKPAVLHPEKDH